MTDTPEDAVCEPAWWHECGNCSHDIMYSKKDIDDNFSCTKCGNQYKYYASKTNFKQEPIEFDVDKQTKKYISIVKKLNRKVNCRGQT